MLNVIYHRLPKPPQYMKNYKKKIKKKYPLYILAINKKKKTSEKRVKTVDSMKCVAYKQQLFHQEKSNCRIPMN